MRWKRPTKLDRTVEIRASNRPVKVAFLVPTKESNRTHAVLDAVFYESYTRWGGCFSLVVPVAESDLFNPQHLQWLSEFDPDFIYSYLDLDQSLVESIAEKCCPIGFLAHKCNDTTEELHWRSYLPNLERHVTPLRSITTVTSPEVQSRVRSHEGKPREPTLLTQHWWNLESRLVTDNFGGSLHTHGSSNSLPGLFRTCALVPPTTASNQVVGNERSNSPVEAFQRVAEGSVLPIANLAMAHSEAVPRFESIRFSSSFQIFVGETVLDRVHFWNCRHLTARLAGSLGAIILRPSEVGDTRIAAAVGMFLNNKNFHGHGGGPYQVKLRSVSLAKAELEDFRRLLSPVTHNSVAVAIDFDAPAFPSSEDFRDRPRRSESDKYGIRLDEDVGAFIAQPPEHLTYLPPQLRSLAGGQWAIDLSIDRHNNLSRFGNVVDSWILPRRLKVARAFTDNLSKPTRTGQLSVLPISEGWPIGGSGKSNNFELRLPSDEEFFRHLIGSSDRADPNDLRKPGQIGYADLSVSDKGQNLRGVISMLGDLSTAYGILTNKFWRGVIAAVNDDSSRPRVFTREKIESFIPTDRATIARLTSEHSFESQKATKKYMKAAATDALEALVRAQVFFMVASWRCTYCGHQNVRRFDDMKLKNGCAICEAPYFAPVDMRWEFELNEFVYRSLHKHAGLPVLWTIGALHDSYLHGAFWYLPEVNLYDGLDYERKVEIDVLCVLDGKFHVIEVKRSATSFLSAGAAERFIAIVNKLQPDVAMLSFEKYSESVSEIAETRLKLAEVADRIGGAIGRSDLKILVAEDRVSFKEATVDYGVIGERIRSL